MQEPVFPKVYASLVAVALLAMGIVLALGGYVGSFLFVNSWGTPFWDTPMSYVTHLGDGAILGGIVGLALARTQPQRVLTLLVLLGIGAGLMAVCKQLFFTGWDRPLRMLGTEAVYHITGHEPQHNSFPSGHTLTAFLATAVWASATKNRVGQAGLAVLAVLLGYSRVYLGVHFVGDVLAGAVLGLLLAAGGVGWMEKRIESLTLARLTDQGRNRLSQVLLLISVVALAIGLFVRLLGGFYD